MAMDGQSMADSGNKYALFPVHVGEQIYSKVMKGGMTLPPAETLSDAGMEHLKVHPYRLNETLPPYDWWRAKNPDNDNNYYEESDFDDLAKANIDAPLYAEACRILYQGTGDDKFPAQLEDCDPDEVSEEEFLYVKNRDPNFFAMKGDIIWCVETEESDLVPVAGGRRSIEGIIFNSADKSDDILEAPTAVEHSEVVLLGRTAPNEPAVLSSWWEVVPNTYETLDIEEYLSCRIARAGGIWVYESIGCSSLRDQQQDFDTDIFGEFDGRARYEELKTAGYYSKPLHSRGS